ncbi:MAG: riboflavin synthase [Chloroflexota bacterium]|nr:riboflavin synthase [Chloroflexota bacterium]
MFTGIIKALGTVTHVAATADGAQLEIAAPGFADTLSEGESVAVNGACLTVAALAPPTIMFSLTPETLSRTNLGDLTQGDIVNLEPALRVGDSLSGHVVQGHVDCTGTILEQAVVGDSVEMRFSAPPEVLRYLIEKGSIAVDGVSLTVFGINSRSFGVSLVQYTQEHTNLTRKPVCASVNLEVDLFAKYVERILQPAQE